MNKLIILSAIAYVISLLRYGIEYWRESLFWVALFAWIQHIVKCIEEDKISLLVIGSILFPIGVINGLVIWSKDYQSYKVE
jgi:hypothetical protein